MVLYPIIIPLAFAILAIAFTKTTSLQKWIALLGSSFTLLASFFLVYQVHVHGSVSYSVGGWEVPYGINFVADRLSVMMVSVSSVIALCSSIYAINDIKIDFQKKNFSPLFLFLITGVNGAYLTGDLFNLYVWFEVLLASSFMLMVMGSKKDQLKGSIKYVVLNLVGSTLFLIGAGLIYGKLGTLNFADIASKIRLLDDSELIYSSSVFLLLAFGLKAGVFPLFFWLPSSYHTPPATVIALFAGLLTKVGLYALLRMSTLFLEPHYDDFKPILIFVAIATMVIGVLGALANKQIKQILSFHIISQVGYIFAGIALMTVNGLAGALFYLMHHILVKSNLFLVAGVIEKRFGSDHIEKTGSLYSLMPLLSLTFFVSAFSLAGLPPLSGFWAKLGVLQASIVDEQWLLTIFVILVGVVTLMSMLKIWLGSFFKPWDNKDGRQIELKPVGMTMLIPCFILGACTCVLGFYAPPFYDFTHQAAVELMNPERYIETVLGESRD